MGKGEPLPEAQQHRLSELLRKHREMGLTRAQEAELEDLLDAVERVAMEGTASEWLLRQRAVRNNNGADT